MRPWVSIARIPQPRTLALAPPGTAPGAREAEGRRLPDAQGSSGSSAGPAAAVAAGALPFAVGTETEGSLMAPAERCGATAMRPTFGAVGRSGVMSLVDSLVRIPRRCLPRRHREYLQQRVRVLYRSGMSLCAFSRVLSNEICGWREAGLYGQNALHLLFTSCLERSKEEAPARRTRWARSAARPPTARRCTTSSAAATRTTRAAATRRCRTRPRSTCRA